MVHFAAIHKQPKGIQMACIGMKRDLTDGCLRLSTRRSWRTGVWVFTLVWLVAAAMPESGASAQGWGDPASGRDIADRWCAACHMVAPDQPQALADVPTFMQIASAVEDDFDVLEGFLIDPHPPMPDMSLTRQEIRDLIAYFATLR
jgi:mono/diheme cytochrome c family protein